MSFTATTEQLTKRISTLADLCKALIADAPDATVSTRRRQPAGDR